MGIQEFRGFRKGWGSVLVKLSEITGFVRVSMYGFTVSAEAWLRQQLKESEFLADRVGYAVVDAGFLLRNFSLVYHNRDLS